MVAHKICDVVGSSGKAWDFYNRDRRADHVLPAVMAGCGLHENIAHALNYIIQGECAMPVKLGINGFGRIGRYLLRLLANDKDIIFTAINARAANDALAYLLKYDPTYGRFREK